MINVYIYLSSGHDAEELTAKMLKARLVAHASIDSENNSMELVDNALVKKTIYVITAQTRALLFNNIVDFVKQNSLEDTKIYSLPITQCNDYFSDYIRNQTILP